MTLNPWKTLQVKGHLLIFDWRRDLPDFSEDVCPDVEDFRMQSLKYLGFSRGDKTPHAHSTQFAMSGF